MCTTHPSQLLPLAVTRIASTDRVVAAVVAAAVSAAQYRLQPDLSLPPLHGVGEIVAAQCLVTGYLGK